MTDLDLNSKPVVLTTGLHCLSASPGWKGSASELGWEGPQGHLGEGKDKRNKEKDTCGWSMEGRGWWVGEMAEGCGEDMRYLEEGVEREQAVAKLGNGVQEWELAVRRSRKVRSAHQGLGSWRGGGTLCRRRSLCEARSSEECPP